MSDHDYQQFINQPLTCEVCSHDVEGTCACPECEKCGVHGDPGCLLTHRYGRQIAEDHSNAKAKLTHYEAVVVDWDKLVKYALDEIYKLIPGEDTMENPDEYYERVTEGVLPMLFDTLRKRKEALTALEAPPNDQAN